MNCEAEDGKVKAKDTLNNEFNHNIEVTEDDEEENKLLLFFEGGIRWSS